MYRSWFIYIAAVYTFKILLICIMNKCKPINSEIYADRYQCRLL